MTQIADAGSRPVGPAYEQREYTANDLEALLGTIEDQGYVILADCVDPVLLSRADARARAAFEEEAPGSKNQEQANARVLANLMGKGSVFWELITEPNLIRCFTSILGYDCLLSSASFRGVLPGCQEQAMHTDDVLYGGRHDWFQRPVERQLSLVATVALSAFTETNGSTVLFPGSHRWPEEPMALPDVEKATDARRHNRQVRGWAKEHKNIEPIKVVMDAGSVAVWYGATWHAGGAYTAFDGEERRSVLFNVCRGIFRPQEAQLALLTRDEVAEMPTALQRLLGYTMSSTGLGYANKQDPALLLGEGGETLLRDNQARSTRTMA